MKRILAIVAIAAFTACSGGSNDSSKVVNESLNGGTKAADGSSVATADSLRRASDSTQQTGDTSALNSVRGDSTSASGIHGQGSGSRVGGGKTGAPQGKKGQK